MLALSVQHRDFSRSAGKGIGENRNERTALVAVQHGIDNVATVGAQHAAVITHCFTGRALDKAVNGARRQLAEQAVLAVLANCAYHVIAFIGFRYQARDLFRRVLQVGIQSDNQVARYVAKASHNGGVLTVVTVKQYGYDVASFNLCGVSEHLGRIVAAAIIYQQNFVRLAHSVTGCRGAADQFRQALLLVVNRDND